MAYANGRGLCLSGGSGGLFSSAQAITFNAEFQPTHKTALVGYPNRAQVSDDGSYGATTTFVSGDSYASVDLHPHRHHRHADRGHPLRPGEAQGLQGRRPLRERELQLLGGDLRSDDNRHFYATLGSGSETYLIEGDITTQTATVLRAGVECPSLSPDGKQIAFKKRLPGAVVTWRLSVLDLSTLADHPLAETRSVDDQAVWLNNTTVAYGLLEGSSATGTSDCPPCPPAPRSSPTPGRCRLTAPVSPTC